MKWYVFRYNVNARTIENFNVFDHGSFKRDVDQLRRRRRTITYEYFSEELRKFAQYYFWSRCEYEVVIQGWPPSHSDVDRKVDIFEQLQLNWDTFVKYVYNYDGKKGATYYIV